MGGLISQNLISKKAISGNVAYSTVNGATATPVDVYATWLACAGIADTFGSLANVIASATARDTLCNNMNALRYMVRSTSTIMPAVLANSGWVTALDSSTYSVKVPTMTGYTTPSGTASATTEYSATYAGWKAFDKTELGGTGIWISANGNISNQRVQYVFPASCYVYKTTVHNYPEFALSVCKPQYYNGSSWVDVNTSDAVASGATKTFLSATIGNSATWGILCSIASGNYIELYEVQFYGLNLS